jgi:hypothetical protein
MTTLSPIAAEQYNVRLSGFTDRDGRHIEVSAQKIGDKLRLRAFLTDGNIILDQYRHDYNLRSLSMPAAIYDFGDQFETIVRFLLPWPLFPENLSATWH